MCLNLLKFYFCGGVMIFRDMIRKVYEYGIKLCEVYGVIESVFYVFVWLDEVVELMGCIFG